MNKKNLCRCTSTHKIKICNSIDFLYNIEIVYIKKFYTNSLFPPIVAISDEMKYF